jgi:hypothetical protein
MNQIAKAEKSPEPRVIATGYVLKAVTLILHDIRCTKCKAVTRASQGTMLRLGKGNDSIFVSPKVAAMDLELPREKRIIETTVDACEECFKEKQVERKDDGLYSLLDRRVGSKNELFIRPSKVEDIEFRMAGNAINQQHPSRRGRPKKPEAPPMNLKEVF